MNLSRSHLWLEMVLIECSYVLYEVNLFNYDLMWVNDSEARGMLEIRKVNSDEPSYLNGGLDANLSRRARSARAAAVSALIGFIGGFRKVFRGIFPDRDSNKPRMYLGA